MAAERAQALARGPSSIFAGGLFRSAQALGASVAGAYAAVFLAEAFGLLLTLWLLREIRVARFQQEVRQLDGVLSQVMD